MATTLHHSKKYAVQQTWKENQKMPSAKLAKRLSFLTMSAMSIGLTIGVGFSLAAPVLPTLQQAMRLLYGPAYTKPGSVVSTSDPQGVRYNKPTDYRHTIVEFVTPWASQTVSLGNKSYFIATGQGYALADPSNPSAAAHYQSAYISAIWFVLEGDRWVVAGKQQNLTADGTFGRVGGKPGAPFYRTIPLGQSVLLVAGEQSVMYQGTSSKWYPVYRFDTRGIRALGALPSGGDNTNAMQPPVISFTGKIIGAKETPGHAPVFTISYTGTTVLNGHPAELANVKCSFVYRQQIASQSIPQRSPSTTPECEAIVASGRF